MRKSQIVTILDLNWDKHKCVISLKLTITIGVLNRLRYEYPEDILLTLILPHLNYCVLFLGANTENIQKFQKKSIERRLFLIGRF